MYYKSEFRSIKVGLITMLKRLFTVMFIVVLAGCSQSSNNENAGQGASGQEGSTASGGNIFAGENIEYIVTTGPGGGYDAYARLIGRYLVKHLGAKNVIINNIPGGGHIVGTNTLWKMKPDGLTLGTFNAGLIYNQIMGVKTLQFDIGKFSWIGKAAGEPRSIVVAEQCPIKSFEDLLNSTETVKFSAAGVGSASYADTKLLAEAFDLNVEIIPGFEGNEGEMSMMRGEVCAQFGTTSSTQPFVDSGYGHFIVSVGGDIPGVPNAMDFAKTEKAQGIVRLIASLSKLGRVTAAPPGVDPAILEQLREAYEKTLTDPELLAEAEKLQLPIDAAFGDDVLQMVLDALHQPPETVSIITDAVRAQ
jgi:tripartite-type tricarboxylate transporter receptor subunit TctC